MDRLCRSRGDGNVPYRSTQMLENGATAFYRCAMKLVGIAATALLVVLTGCPNEARNDSINAANEGAKAYGQKQYETAIAAYQQRHREVGRQPQRLVRPGRRVRRQAGLEPRRRRDVARGPARARAGMYQMWYGRLALREGGRRARARRRRRRENKKAEEVEPDLTSGQLREAAAAPPGGGQAQQRPVARALLPRPDLPRHRQAKEAADELTKALQAEPDATPARGSRSPSSTARWDYTDQAIQVAEAGTAIVPGSNEKSDIWFEVGMGYDDKRLNDKAIEAFTKAIEARRDNHKAQFQRGQAYFRKGDYANAKRDLEDFGKSGGASLEFAKQQASKMLMDIAAKSVVPGSTPVEQPPPADAGKKGKAGKAKHR